LGAYGYATKQGPYWPSEAYDSDRNERLVAAIEERGYSLGDK
jgi:hypothetical protein